MKSLNACNLFFLIVFTSFPTICMDRPAEVQKNLSEEFYWKTVKEGSEGDLQNLNLMILLGNAAKDTCKGKFLKEEKKKYDAGSAFVRDLAIEEVEHAARKGSKQEAEDSSDSDSDSENNAEGSSHFSITSSSQLEVLKLVQHGHQKFIDDFIKHASIHLILLIVVHERSLLERPYIQERIFNTDLELLIPFLRALRKMPANDFFTTFINVLLHTKFQTQITGLDGLITFFDILATQERLRKEGPKALEQFLLQQPTHTDNLSFHLHLPGFRESLLNGIDDEMKEAISETYSDISLEEDLSNDESEVPDAVPASNAAHGEAQSACDAQIECKSAQEPDIEAQAPVFTADYLTKKALAAYTKSQARCNDVPDKPAAAQKDNSLNTHEEDDQFIVLEEGESIAKKAPSLASGMAVTDIFDDLPLKKFGHGFGMYTLVRIPKYYRPIEQLHDNPHDEDEILVESYNTKTKRYVNSKIVRTSMGRTNCYIELGFSGKDCDIKCIPWQPFYVEPLKQWVPAYKLKAGDHLLSKGGAVKMLTTMRLVKSQIEIYMLEIKGTHTFFVGGDQILTQNMAIPAVSLSFSWAFGQGATIGGARLIGIALGSPTIITAIIGAISLSVSLNKKYNNKYECAYEANIDTKAIERSISQNDRQPNSPGKQKKRSSGNKEPKEPREPKGTDRSLHVNLTDEELKIAEEAAKELVNYTGKSIKEVLDPICKVKHVFSYDHQINGIFNLTNKAGSRGEQMAEIIRKMGNIVKEVDLAGLFKSGKNTIQIMMNNEPATVVVNLKDSLWQSLNAFTTHRPPHSKMGNLIKWKL